MIDVRRSNERGHANHGWLDTYHTFSFADYHDPEHMGFGPLRVINEDVVAPGQGFGAHPHHNMEILTWVLEGKLSHRDSLGNGSTIGPGQIQRMSAGTGIRHSEFNGSDTDPVHLLQIWIHPERRGLTPEYEEKTIPRDTLQNKLALLAAPDADGHAVRIHQDVRVYASDLAAGETLDHTLAADRVAWIQVARGRVSVNDVELNQGDGASTSNEPNLRIKSLEDAHILLFDMRVQ